MNRFSSTRRTSLAPWVSLVLALAFVHFAGAATPLHRCARESWPVENYHAYVFHHGGVDPADQELVDVLTSAPAKLGVNLLVATVDTAEPMVPAISALWEAQAHAETPWMIVQSPQSFRSNTVIWTSALRTPAIGALLTSPVRQRIAEHLVEGHAAVWLLVECGEAIRDEAAVDTLTSTLAQLSKPQPASSNKLSQPKASAAQPHFSIVRVTREDPSEQFLLRSLGVLEDPNPLPIAFPIFGRGRTLPPLAGRKLNEHSIEKVCRELLADCTNSVRETSSGSELLLAASWDAPVTPSVPATNTHVETSSERRDSAARSETDTPPARSERSDATKRDSIDLAWLGGFAGGLLLAALAGFAVVRVWRAK